MTVPIGRSSCSCPWATGGTEMRGGAGAGMGGTGEEMGEGNRGHVCLRAPASAACSP